MSLGMICSKSDSGRAGVVSAVSSCIEMGE